MLRNIITHVLQGQLLRIIPLYRRYHRVCVCVCVSLSLSVKFSNNTCIHSIVEKLCILVMETMSYDCMSGRQGYSGTQKWAMTEKRLRTTVRPRDDQCKEA